MTGHVILSRSVQQRASNRDRQKRQGRVEAGAVGKVSRFGRMALLVWGLLTLDDPIGLWAQVHDRQGTTCAAAAPTFYRDRESVSMAKAFGVLHADMETSNVLFRLRTQSDANLEGIAKGRFKTWQRDVSRYRHNMFSGIGPIPGMSGRTYDLAAPQQLVLERGPSGSPESGSFDVKAVLQEAAETANRSMRTGKGEVVGRIAVAQARAGDLQGAFQTTLALTSVQDRLSTSGKIAEARAELGDMKGVNQALDRISAEDLAAKIMTLAGSLSTQGKFAALRAVALAHARAGNVEAAEHAVSRIEFGSLHPELSGRVQGDLLRELAIIYADQNNTKEAMRKVEGIKDRVKRESALAEVSVKLAEKGDVAGTRVAVTMLQQGKPDAKTASQIVKALMKIGERDQAIQYLQPMVRSALNAGNDWALRDLLDAQAMVDPAGAQQTALALSDKATLSGPSQRDAGLAIVARGRAKAGDSRAALGAVEPIRDMNTKSETLSMVVHSLIEARNAAEAVKAAKMIERPYWKPTLARAQAIAGDLTGALRTASSLPNPLDQSRALAEIVKVQVETGQLLAAARTATGIQDNSVKSQTYREVAAAQARAGQLPAALESVEHVSERYRPETLWQVARIDATVRQPAAVLIWVRQHKDLYERAWAMLGVADSMLDRAGH